MMITYVPPCLEGRVLSIMVSLKMDPLLISPDLLARPILLVHPLVELILQHHILQMVPSKVAPLWMGSILACSLIEQKQPPPPEPPPPTIFNIHQKVTKNGMLPKDPPIFNPEDFIGHPKENGETTNESLKIISPDNQVTLEMDFSRHENNMLCIDKFVKNYE
jgi:hypothetical protein